MSGLLLLGGWPDTPIIPFDQQKQTATRTGKDTEMIGKDYWATGITVNYGYSGSGAYGWGAEVKYFDAGFCSDDTDAGRVSTEGELRTRYYVRQGETADALTVAIDTIKADAERLGITWQDNASVYYKGDGEDSEDPAPEGWRDLVDSHTRRLGWQAIYGGKISAE